jgi:hypothetical protein
VAEPPLRVSLDVSAVPVRAVGAGHYTLQLARVLATRSEVDMTLFGRRDDVRRWGALAPASTVIGSAPTPAPGLPCTTVPTTRCLNDRRCRWW